MKIQIASDLHLEFSNGENAKLVESVDRDLLILAGDIAVGRGSKSFIAEQLQFSPVIMYQAIMNTTSGVAELNWMLGGVRSQSTNFLVYITCRWMKLWLTDAELEAQHGIRISGVVMVDMLKKVSQISSSHTTYQVFGMLKVTRQLMKLQQSG